LEFTWGKVVDVAPDPVFSGLDGADERMGRGMKMFGGVFVLGGIAAAYFAAGQAEPQMDPGVTCLDTFFALVFAGVFELDLVDVSAVGAKSFHEAGLLSITASIVNRGGPQGLKAQENLQALRGPFDSAQGRV
jgi:hypothetical protein